MAFEVCLKREKARPESGLFTALRMIIVLQKPIEISKNWRKNGGFSRVSEISQLFPSSFLTAIGSDSPAGDGELAVEMDLQQENCALQPVVLVI
jgi:hypothetical protein